MSRYLKRTVLATALAGLLIAGKTSACELDGMSHGYGPMAALFAGAHRYQSLNGLDDEPPPEPVAAVESVSNTDAEEEAVADTTSAPTAATAFQGPGAASTHGGMDTASGTRSPTPRRSFASWVRAAPKPTDPLESSESGN